MTELLLLSNSRAPGLAFLEHAAGAIRAVLGDRARILFGPYLGTSAGSNVDCPSSRTTNDMPIDAGR